MGEVGKRVAITLSLRALMRQDRVQAIGQALNFAGVASGNLLLLADFEAAELVGNAT